MNKIKSITLAILAFVLSIGVFGAISLNTAKNSVFADETEIDLNALTSFEMVNGASVYVSATDENKTGIKFKATISNDEYDALTKKNAQFGFIIMPADYVSDPSYELTVENLFGGNSVYCFEGAGHSDDCTKKHISQTLDPIITDVEGGKEISASLVGILTNNISRAFVGLAYVRVVDESLPSIEGEDRYAYALASFEGGRMGENTRSMLYIAQVAVENGDDMSDFLIENYFAPLAERNLKIKYYAFFHLYSADGKNLITNTEAEIFSTPFSGTGLTKVKAPDYNGSDERFLNATKQNPDVEYVVYNELRTTIEVKYYQNKTENPQKGLTAEDIYCYEDPVVSADAAASSDITVTYLYNDSENGEFKALSEINGGKLTAGTWFVKAVLGETSSYLETTTDPVSFTVSHKLSDYFVGEEEDTPVCLCGATMPDMDTFKTKVTEPRQDIILSSAEAIGISLGGVSEYDSVYSITCGGASLGKNISDLNVSELSDVIHGETNIVVEVLTDNFIHKVTVPVTLITDVITDRDVLLHTVQCHSGNKTAKTGEGKYYILGADIELGNVNSHTFGGETYTSTYSYDIDAQIGFAGTLDGRGHSLNGVVSNGTSGIFGFVNGATVKNLNISFDSYKGSCIFGYYVVSANVSDVNIMINTPIDNTSSEDVGLLAHNQAKECTFKNLVIHAEGSSLRQLTSKGWLGLNCTYTDCVIYAKEYINSAATATNLPSGLTFTATDAVKNAYVELSKETFDITLPQSFSGYTVEGVSINGTDFGTSLIGIKTEACSSFTLGEEYPLVITLKNDAVSFKVKTNVIVVTKVITEWNEFLHNVQYHTGNAGALVGENEYYVLGNDIVGGGVWGHTIDGTAYNVTTNTDDLDNFYGFAGTLDGAGYTISNVTINAVGLFGSLYKATIKNLNVDIRDWVSDGSAIFAYWMYQTSVENVTVNIQNASGDLSQKGILADNQAKNCTFTNFTLNAKGIKLGKIGSAGYWGGYSTTYKNCKIYAADYTNLGGDRTGGIEGFTFYMDTQDIVLAGDTVSIKVPTGIDSVVHRIRINGVVLEAPESDNSTVSGGITYYAHDLSSVSVADIKAAIGDKYGYYEVQFLVNGCYEYLIPVNFVVPSGDIDAE